MNTTVLLLNVQENQLGPCGVDISVDDIANRGINTCGRCHENLSVIKIQITNNDGTSTSIAFNSGLHTASAHSTHHHLSFHLLPVQRIREAVPFPHHQQTKMSLNASQLLTFSYTNRIEVDDVPG